MLLRSPGGTRSLSASAAAKPPPPRPPLASLDLAGCVLLTERGFAALASGLASSLTQLAIGGCSRVSTVSDAVLAEVARCTNLRALDMAGCTHVTDEGARFAHFFQWCCLCAGCARSGCKTRGLLLGCRRHAASLARSCCAHAHAGVLHIPSPHWLASSAQSAVLIPAASTSSTAAAGVAHLSSLHRLTNLNLWNCLRVSGGQLSQGRACFLTQAMMQGSLECA